MKSRNKKTSDIEIEKAKDYLLDSKKNIERLKKGKKPRRKIKHLISEHKFLTFLIVALIIFLAFTPLLVPKPPPVIVDPFEDAVNTALETIESNFTDQNNLPFQSETETIPSSELIILSSLTNSFLKQTDKVSNNPELFQRISNLDYIIKNDSFIRYDQSNELLPISFQFLGIYTQLQAYHSTQGLEIAMDLQEVYSLVIKSINDYYHHSEDFGMMRLPSSNVTYLIDQAMAMFTIATFSIISNVEYIGGFGIYRILDNLRNTITENFYNVTTESFYHKFDSTTNTSSGAASIEDLIFLNLGLSKSDKRFPYEFYSVFFSPYSIHQKIMNEFVDSNWKVHNSSIADNNLLIKNHALFMLCSYLLRLNSVGDEIRNATMKVFLTFKGFANNNLNQEITCESCLYGLISIVCEEWSLIQNRREDVALPTPTPTEDAYYPFLISLILIAFIITWIRRKRRF
jgi:hypothetical protein